MFVYVNAAQLARSEPYKEKKSENKKLHNHALTSLVLTSVINTVDLKDAALGKLFLFLELTDRKTLPLVIVSNKHMLFNRLAYKIENIFL